MAAAQLTRMGTVDGPRPVAATSAGDGARATGGYVSRRTVTVAVPWMPRAVAATAAMPAAVAAYRPAALIAPGPFTAQVTSPAASATPL